VAVEFWSKFQWDLSSRKGLDGALAAFDMFFLHDQPQDIDYVGFGKSRTLVNG
jgi:F-box protein 21